jgi:chromosome segregation ATPase
MAKSASILKPGRSPERETLAQAIEREREAVRRLAETKAAEERRFDAFRSASRAAEAAEKAVEEARSSEHARVVAEFTGDAAAPVAGLADAERAAERARAEAARLRDARAALEAAHREALNEFEHAQSAVRRAVEAVMRAEIDVGRLLGDARRAQADLIAQRIVIRWLERNGFVALPMKEAVARFMIDIDLPAGFGVTEMKDWSRHEAAGPFIAAREALLRDADAPLPG